tara:strand:+ start:18904 stop:20637 length:1734 start_codon:yes stop_codon:yes gene_type:complete
LKAPNKEYLSISYKTILLIAIVYFANFNNLLGQISPGELSKAHSIFEGVVYCSKCHFIGEEANNTKCLECHTEIKSLIEQKRGYHSSLEVDKKDCWECHNEHHGRDFQLIKFDKDKFDHDLTKFKLKGEHEKLDCIKCHNFSNILKQSHKKINSFSTKEVVGTQQSIEKNLEQCKECHLFTEKEKLPEKIEEIGYLGLNNQCASCHNDYHQGTLGVDCKSCHNEEKFRPAKLFSHKETDFKLTGSHIDLECTKCHKKEIKNNREFQKFTNMKFNNCVECHEDKDIHKQKFGVKCQECHTTKSFREVNRETFNHTKTNFKLQGKHENLECKKCHKQRVSVLKPNAEKCSSCHESSHTYKDNIQKDCVECHTTNTFSLSTFTVENHNELDFKLKHSHLAVACDKCHLKEEKWNFKIAYENCINCHENSHLTELPEEYFNPGGCYNCHNQRAWTSVRFNHDKTKFELKGKHTELECRSCHVETKGKDKIIKFASKDRACENCHKENHQNQFIENGVTECSKCHVQGTWEPELFDHQETKFKLEGKHLDLECSKCHLLIKKNNVTYRKYSYGGITCINCHL